MRFKLWPFENTNDKRKLRLASVYVMYIFFTLHYALPLYINSSFLSSLSSDTTAGLAYTVAAIIAIAAIITTSRAVVRFGDYLTARTLIIGEIAAVILLATPVPLWLTFFAFIAHWVFTATIKYNFDIFLERFSDDETTSATRGAYITFGHIALIIAILLAGFVVGTDIFWRVYLMSAVFGLPTLYVLVRQFKDFPDPNYSHQKLTKSLKKVWRSVNVRFILAVLFVLRLFYAWMAIYTPIYLHQHLGFPFETIGVILAVMLLPFVLLSEPLGDLADRLWGEKEILAAGFLVTAGFTALMAFVSSTSAVVWALVLFGTRIGATAIQVMAEGYFFKHVEGRDSDTISIRRIIKPTAYIVAPLFAAGMLFFVPFRFIFLGIAFIVACGTLLTIPIVDTR